MSEPVSHPSEPRTEPKVQEAPALPRSGTAVPKAAGGLLLLALAVSVLALVMSGMLWQQLGQAQQELARRSQDSAVQVVEARTLAAQAEALTQEMQARLSVAEVRLSEVSLQRSQLEELMLALSRSRDDNLVQDLDSTLRLAQQQAQLTGSAQPLISALQAADQRISRAAQPRLNPVQRAIARDIERIQATALADIPALVLRLDELARQVDEWPLVNSVGAQWPPDKARGKAVHAQAQPTAPASPAEEGATPALVEASVTEPPPAATDASTGTAMERQFSQGWARVSDGWAALWTRIWTDVTRSGRELVRVSRIDQPEAVLLAPEQSFFLRENIKLKILNARLGLLARQIPSAQADVVAVEAALARYFDDSVPLVRSARVSLAQLRRDLVITELPRLEESFAALATASGGR